MKLRPVLLALARAIADESETNAPFRQKLEAILQPKDDNRKPQERKPAGATRRGRRAPAVLDPIDLIEEGALTLRERLQQLELEQLKDIVAQFGMDPSKLVMKWKDRQRIIDRIVEVSHSRSTKGDAFRR
jgi:hypothetical protein